MLNTFRTLIHPSSGAYDCVVELSHRSSCSQFAVCWKFGSAGFEWCSFCRLKPANSTTQSQAPDDGYINRLAPNDLYMGRTAPPTSNRCILYIYSTNIGTEYFKHALYSPFISLENAVCFIMLTCLVPVLLTLYIQGVLILKK